MEERKLSSTDGSDCNECARLQQDFLDKVSRAVFLYSEQIEAVKRNEASFIQFEARVRAAETDRQEAASGLAEHLRYHAELRMLA